MTPPSIQKRELVLQDPVPPDVERVAEAVSTIVLDDICQGRFTTLIVLTLRGRTATQ